MSIEYRVQVPFIFNTFLHEWPLSCYKRGLLLFEPSCIQSRQHPFWHLDSGVHSTRQILTILKYDFWLHLLPVIFQLLVMVWKILWYFHNKSNRRTNYKIIGKYTWCLVQNVRVRKEVAINIYPKKLHLPARRHFQFSTK